MTKTKIALIYAALSVVTFVAFWQVNNCEFINYDDDLYVTENIAIRNGITVEAIRWAITTYHASNWHPLTWMSHMLDVQLFGLNPRWHHLTNLLFHVANTLLLFTVLHQMTQAPWRSGFVAALFGLHPLHVESVAWVAERKDVLSTLFWMLTLGAYLLYAKRPGWLRYLAVVVCFVLGLMAKPMLVTLPFVLLLLDFWPLMRFAQNGIPAAPGAEARKPVPEKKRKGKASKTQALQSSLSAKAVEPNAKQPATRAIPWTRLWPLLREKIPLFALTTLSCIVTYIAQKEGGAVTSFEVLPMGDRIANAFVSYILYIAKMIWPSDLAVLYPHPGTYPLWQVLGALALFVASTLGAIRCAHRFPYATVGWLWYASTLVPVIGLVQVGGHALADRYTYVPLIGLFIIAAWGIPELLNGWRWRNEAIAASAALILAGLSIVTWTQVGFWQNSIKLYDHAMSQTLQSSILFNNRGHAYASLANFNRAIQDYDRAVEIDPRFADAYNNRGTAYSSLGNYSAAIADFDRAIEIGPVHKKYYYNRGNAFSNLGSAARAIQDYDRAIEIDPRYAGAYNNRGAAYGGLGNFNHAMADFDRAIAIDPRFARAYTNRGITYLGLGAREKAREDLKTAARLGSETAKKILRSNNIGW